MDTHGWRRKAGVGSDIRTFQEDEISDPTLVCSGWRFFAGAELCARKYGRRGQWQVADDADIWRKKFSLRQISVIKPYAGVEGKDDGKAVKESAFLPVEIAWRFELLPDAARPRLKR
jgi:hypothetical protein